MILKEYDIQATSLGLPIPPADSCQAILIGLDQINIIRACTKGVRVSYYNITTVQCLAHRVTPLNGISSVLSVPEGVTHKESILRM